MTFRTFLWIIFLVSSSLSGFTQSLPQVEPLHWWTSMPTNEVMIMIHQDGIGEWTPTVREKSLRLKEVIPCPNPDYLFLTLNWDAVFKPSTVIIQLEKAGQIQEIPYTFKARARGFKPAGLQSSDVIYRVTTDRFANGDPENDQALPGKVNRKDPLARHGGDLRGVLDQIDYVRGLGMTAIQLDPVQKNDSRLQSWNGNQITSHFELDPRFGDTTIYSQLIRKLHQRDMKIVQNMNFSTVDGNHLFSKNPPFSDWMDEQSGREEGGLRRLRGENALLLKYLTQVSWWWMEEFHLDAVRFASCETMDPTVLKHLSEQLALAYPGVSIITENETDGREVGAVPVADGCGLPIRSNDAFQHTIARLHTSNDGPVEPVQSLYQWMVENERQKDPDGSILYVDNAHLPRYHDRKDKKLEKWKMGLAVMATSRGIPSITAGTEILIKPPKRFPLVQADFPGGWSRDRKDKFTKEGRTKNEEEAYRYLQRLMTWRSRSQAIIRGTSVAYPPQEGVFAWFRRYGEQLVMVVINTDPDAQEANLNPWMDTIRGYTIARDIFSGKEYPLDGIWELEGLETRVLELER